MKAVKIRDGLGFGDLEVKPLPVPAVFALDLGG